MRIANIEQLHQELDYAVRKLAVEVRDLEEKKSQLVGAKQRREALELLFPDLKDLRAP